MDELQAAVHLGGPILLSIEGLPHRVVRRLQGRHVELKLLATDRLLLLLGLAGSTGLQFPHIDATRYLVASTPETVEPGLIEIMTTFMEPFEGDLWLLIVATMFVFGTVIWYLEKDSK